MWNCNSINMPERNLFIDVLFLIIAIIFSAISPCSSALSDKRLCYDPNCSVPVSLARTSLGYRPKEPELLGFESNVIATVYSKEAGNRTDLWGVEIDGKHGYVPKMFLKEYKILQKKLSYEVPTHPLSNDKASSKEKHRSKSDKGKSIFDEKDFKVSDKKNDNLKSTEELPHNVMDVSPSYEVIDGTTVHLDTNEPSIKTTFVKDFVQATAVPNKQDTIDDSEISYANNKTESTIFTKDDKKEAQDSLNDKQSVSNEVDIKNFVSSSEEIPDFPIISGIISPLNISEKSLFTDATKQPLEDVIHTNVPETIVTESVGKTLNVKDEAGIELDKKDSIEADAASDTKLDIKNVEISEENKKEAVESLEDTTIAVASDIKSDEQIAEISEKRKDEVAESLENATISVGNDIKLDEQIAEISEENNKEAIESLENTTIAVASDIKSDEQIAEISEQRKEEVAESLENATIPLGSDIKSDEQIAEISEAKDSQTSKDVTVVATNDIKLDVQNIGTSVKVEEQSIKTTENVTLPVPNNTQSDIKSSNEIEKQDTQSAENITTDTSTDAKSNVQSVESTNKINTEEQSSESATVAETEDIELNIRDTGITDETHTKSIESLESVTIDTKDSEQLELKQSELEKEEESKNTEDFGTYGSKYVSPLFSNLNATEIPVTSSGDIEASSKVEEFHSKDIQFESKIINDVFTKSVISAESSSEAEETVDIKVETSDIQHDLSDIKDAVSMSETTSENIFHEMQVSPPNVCAADDVECPSEDIQYDFPRHEQVSPSSVNAIMGGIQIESNHWTTLIYLSVTVMAVLIFSLGYYYIENMRRDRQFIARINKLEKELLISEAENAKMNEKLLLTKEESMLSLKANLQVSQNEKTELEERLAMVEKDLESATEAGLELERMLREVLSSNDEVNPLAQSLEDLQTRLNAQQAANESLTNALNFKTQENTSLSSELASAEKSYKELEIEFNRVMEDMKQELSRQKSVEQSLTEKVQRLEMQIEEISTEKAVLQKQLKGKEVEAKDLLDVINQLNSNNLDFDKLYDVSRIKAEATALLEERNELSVRLVEVEGAHTLLEEHVKTVKEEMASLSEQCKLAEKEKKDAETRLEVLRNFFEEKEAQRQKEEAVWLQQQGEVLSTVERIQSMQSEIQNYKQQTEMLKREILDQEREYKKQMSLLETKAHEQWVVARQVERRLDESKVEAGQLRNRLTLIEKNINEVDPEVKLHRLEANGETTTSPPLFIGAESSSSPIMFSGSSNVPPPPPPSYLQSLFPPYLPPPLPNTSGVPPYEVSQRPPPLGGRLSSPPPMPLHPSASNRYDNASSPPPMSPHLLPPFNHRSPPPFGSDIHPPPPPPHHPGSMLPPPLGAPHSWGEESLPHPRHSGFHPAQRERVRNHKGSLHSSGDSLDKLHHNSKV